MSRCTLIALVICSFNALHMGHIYHRDNDRDNCILVDTLELIKAPGNALGSACQATGIVVMYVCPNQGGKHTRSFLLWANITW